MTNQAQNYRIHSHMTRSRFLHIEDALVIGKVRIFAGEYTRGNGADMMACHYLDIADARVLLSDLSWGKPVNFCEFKGSPGNEDSSPVSRVLKVRSSDGKIWIRLETGPGQIIGEGAVKPAGDPDVIVNVPFTIWEARKLAHAVLAHLAAWEAVTFQHRTEIQQGAEA